MKTINNSAVITKVILLIIAFSFSYASSAYEKWQPGACSEVEWLDDENFYIMGISFNTSEKQYAVAEPGWRINDVGGQWFDFIFYIDNFYYPGTGNGYNEIYAITNLPSGAAGQAWRSYTWTPWNGCYLDEADVRMNANFDWIWNVPNGFWPKDVYYNPRPFLNPDGTLYFRTVVMHEFLHAVGLSHESGDLAHMVPVSFSGSDAGGFINDTYDQAYRVVPLPDDRQGLRDLYESSGTETDLSIATFWTDDRYDDEEAHHRTLCVPAKRDGFSSNQFSIFCASNGSRTEICSGDTIYVRYTLLNFGTSGKTFNINYWASFNAHLGSEDLKSSTTHSQYVASGSSHRLGKSFTFPSNATLDAEYHVIVEIEGVSGEDTDNNWIPMPGTLETASSCP